MVSYNAVNIQIILRIFNEITALILRTIAFLALALTLAVRAFIFFIFPYFNYKTHRIGKFRPWRHTGCSYLILTPVNNTTTKQEKMIPPL